MKTFAKINDKGDILYTASYSEDIPPDPTLMELPQDFTFDPTVYFDQETKAFEKRPERPANSVWDGKAWAPDIEGLKRDATFKKLAILASSDYTMLLDSPVANKKDWIDYRKAIRDIDTNDPLSIIWPVAPPVTKL